MMLCPTHRLPLRKAEPKHTGTRGGWRPNRQPLSKTSMARKGKIARLPLAIREEVNRRLLEGQTAAKILPWLNELPEVKAVLEEDFEGLRVRDNNLSEWRKGGYAEWLARRDRIERTRELSKLSVDLAKAGGGNIAEGAAGILSGRILDVLEKLDDLVDAAEAQPTDGDEGTGEGGQSGRLALIGQYIGDLTLAVSRLRKGDLAAEQLRLNRERLAQTGEALELERAKFQRQTCDLFLKWRENARALAIADGPGTHDEKVEALGQAMFGDLWK